MIGKIVVSAKATFTRFAYSPLAGRAGSRLSGGRFIALVSIALFVGFRPAPAAADPFAYVTNFDSDTVSVIDTASNIIVATVPVGDGPYGVTATPDGAFVYVGNSRSGTVSVIDTTDNSVVDTVGVGIVPEGVAVTPDGAFVYVTNRESGTVSVIDTADNTVVKTVDVTRPRGVAITPNGAFVYVASTIADVVSVIATASNTVVATVPVVLQPQGVAVAPNGAFVYISSTGEGSNFPTVSVIATADNSVVDTVPVGIQPFRLAVTPDGAFIYVANNEGTVSVIDTTDNSVVDTVGVGTSPRDVAITPDGAFAYVANSGSASNSVSVINTQDNSVMATVGVGMTPLGVAIVGIVASTQPTQVSINIKPGSNPNSINTCSGGTTPVAIFGSDTLDVTTIDPGSLMLASATVKTVGKTNRDLCNVEDIGSVDETAFDSLDTLPDGFDDLVCHFVTFDLTDLADTSEDATLDGNLADGTAIEGLDSVNIVKDCS